MNRGWVKDWRKAEDNPLYWDIGPWHLFCHLIRSAKYQDTGELSRGQCLINCHNLAKCYGVSRSTIHRWLDKLRKTGLISSCVVAVPKRATRNILVSVINYDTYQSEESECGTSSEQARNKLGTSSGQLYKKEGKKGRREEEVLPAKHTYPDTFQSWWRAYPLRKGKRSALTAWKRARRSVADEQGVELSEAAEYLRSKARAFAQSDDATRDGGKYIPHPATWLNAGRYDDEETTIQKPAIRFE